MATKDIVFGQQTITIGDPSIGPNARYNIDGTTLINPVNGVPSDYLSAPGKIPNGLDWLTETTHGFDIYASGFVQRPTLFFDPTATTSLNRGTFQNPYNTQAALQAVIKGDMRGQVLGFKRGTEFNPTDFELTVYGSSSAPFTICPYGDAEALPIISAHSVPTWTQSGLTAAAISANIWKYAIGATQHDVWQSGVRLTNKTWSTDPETTLTAAGTATFNSNTLYIRPYDGESPNLGQVYVSVGNYTFLLKYSDVAASGYIEVAGLDLRYARNTVLPITAATGAASITSVEGIRVVGCKIGHAGYDVAGLTLASDAMSIYGLSDTVRMKDVYVAGNELYDALNNAVEVAGMDGSADGKPVIIEHNYGHDCGGNLAELWSSNNDVTVRYNYGHTFSNYGRLYTSFSAGGIWFTNYYETGGTWNNNDATNTKNTNNKAVFNLFEDCALVCADVRGGSGHVVAHNTWIIDHDAIYGAASGKSHLPAGFYTNGTAAAGFCDWSNNILYYKTANLVPEAYLNVSFVNIVAGLGAANSTPTGNNNVYYVGTGYNVANWKYAFTGISGTAQAGAATTITLAAGSKASTDYYKGGTVTITGGTGSGQAKTISTYNGTTKVATVSSAWSTNPDATSTYTITGFASRNKFLESTNAAWQYDLAQASVALDQNSLASLSGTTYGNIGGTLTTALIGMDFTTFTPLAANIAGKTSLTGIGTRYKDGQPYAAATPTIGCYLGG